MRATVAVVKDPFGGRPPPRGGRQLPVREPCGVVAASYRCGNPVSGEDHHPVVSATGSRTVYTRQ